MLSEKAMASHSSTLAWKIPWMEEAGGLPSMGSHRVGHDWSDLAVASPFYGITNSMDMGLGWTPGVGDGQRGLACCGSLGHKESDMTVRLNWTQALFYICGWCSPYLFSCLLICSMIWLLTKLNLFFPLSFLFLGTEDCFFYASSFKDLSIAFEKSWWYCTFSISLCGLVEKALGWGLSLCLLLG